MTEAREPVSGLRARFLFPLAGDANPVQGLPPGFGMVNLRADEGQADTERFVSINLPSRRGGDALGPRAYAEEVLRQSRALDVRAAGRPDRPVIVTVEPRRFEGGSHALALVLADWSERLGLPPGVADRFVASGELVPEGSGELPAVGRIEEKLERILALPEAQFGAGSMLVLPAANFQVGPDDPRLRTLAARGVAVSLVRHVREVAWFWPALRADPRVGAPIRPFPAPHPTPEPQASASPAPRKRGSAWLAVAGIVGLAGAALVLAPRPASTPVVVGPTGDGGAATSGQAAGEASEAAPRPVNSAVAPVDAWVDPVPAPPDPLVLPPEPPPQPPPRPPTPDPRPAPPPSPPPFPPLPSLDALLPGLGDLSVTECGVPPAPIRAVPGLLRQVLVPTYGTVRRSTPLRALPRDDAPVIGRLAPGARLCVAALVPGTFVLLVVSGEAWGFVGFDDVAQD